jgi:hypothetical protein
MVTRQRIYWIVRDLHLYTGLFVSPFVLVFAFSVFALVHPSGTPTSAASTERVVRGLEIEADVGENTGSARLAAVRHVLDQCMVRGEIGFITHIPKENRLIVPVNVPGRETTVTIDLKGRTAEISNRETGMMGSLVLLHKSPGPHLVDIRMNWMPMRIWHWLADVTVYLVLFLSASGIYLWLLLRSERLVGVVLLTAGALSFVGLVYALIG